MVLHQTSNEHNVVLQNYVCVLLLRMVCMFAELIFIPITRRKNLY